MNNDVPSIKRISTAVAAISADIAEELGMEICAGSCKRYYAREQLYPSPTGNLLCTCCLEDLWGREPSPAEQRAAAAWGVRHFGIKE